MNILEELEDLFSLAEDDEKFALKQCYIAIKKVQERRPEYVDPNKLSELHDRYLDCVEEGLRIDEWPEAVQLYYQYQVKGNVMGSGGDMPYTRGVVGLEDPEEWGIADVYPLAEVEG